MQFLVLAYDGKDEGALERRLTHREAHLAGARQMKAAGTLLTAGAILDAEERMVGSMLVVDFPSRQALEAFVAADPYTQGGVWQTVEIHPFRVAPL